MCVFDYKEYLKFYYGTDDLANSDSGFIRENRAVIDFVIDNVQQTLVSVPVLDNWCDVGSSGVFYPYYLFAPFVKRAIFSDIDKEALNELGHEELWEPYWEYINERTVFAKRRIDMECIPCDVLKQLPPANDFVTSFFCIDTLPNFDLAFANFSKSTKKYMFVAGIEVEQDYYLVEDQKVYGSSVSFDRMKQAFIREFDILAAQNYPAILNGTGGYKEFYCVFGRRNTLY